MNFLVYFALLGFIFLLNRIIEENKFKNFDTYSKKLSLKILISKTIKISGIFLILLIIDKYQGIPINLFNGIINKGTLKINTTIKVLNFLILSILTSTITTNIQKYKHYRFLEEFIDLFLIGVIFFLEIIIYKGFFNSLHLLGLSLGFGIIGALVIYSIKIKNIYLEFIIALLTYFISDYLTKLGMISLFIEILISKNIKTKYKNNKTEIFKDEKFIKNIYKLSITGIIFYSIYYIITNRVNFVIIETAFLISVFIIINNLIKKNKFKISFIPLIVSFLLIETFGGNSSLVIISLFFCSIGSSIINKTVLINKNKRISKSKSI